MTINEWCARWRIPPQAIAELVMPLPTSNSGIAAGRSETFVQSTIRLAAAERGVYLWRNNSGAATDQSGRLIRYGLGNDSQRVNALFKSSDLIGIARDGRFLAIECKAPAWRGPTSDHDLAQARFIATVQAAGGIGGFVRSVGDFNALVR